MCCLTSIDVLGRVAGTFGGRGLGKRHYKNFELELSVSSSHDSRHETTQVKVSPQLFFSVLYALHD
jgi:hypothetical protein